jgi:drug/metabolite transporter (DMT)-like permease
VRPKWPFSSVHFPGTIGVVPRTHPARGGHAVALLSAVVFSTTAIFIRHLTEAHRLPPLVLAAWRSVLVAVALVVALGLLAPRRLRLQRGDLRVLGVQGAVLALFNVVWTLSVARCGASVATALAYTSGAFTALFGAWFLRERAGASGWAAVVLCLGGTAVLSGAFSGPAALRPDALGLGAGLLSGAGYAGYSVLGRISARRGIDPWAAVLYTFAVGGAVQLALLGLAPLASPGAAGLSDLLWLGRSAEGWAALVGLAAGPTVLGFGLYNVSLGRLPASTANLVLTLEPAFTAAIAWPLLGERLGAAELAGGLVIMSGVAVLRLGERAQRAGAAATEPAPAEAVRERAA